MKLSAIILFIVAPFITSAQIFFNNGATIWTGPQSIIQVNGGFENNSSTSNGDIEHNGQMWVTLNSTFPNPGDVTLNNNSTLHGNGYYFVEQDWVNNASFVANNSTVELYGSLQEMITGTVVTTYHNLTLTGTGTGINKKKTQTLDANIDATGTLKINDRELATDANTMFVLNTSSACVTNSTIAGSEGFVSSLGLGRLSRATNGTASYLFPIGSSLGTTRYRPVVMTTPTGAGADTYAARLANNLASLDTYDTSLIDVTVCQVNPDYYHRIDRTSGTDNSDIAIYFDPAADGQWDGLAQWNTPTTTLWNDMSTVTTAAPQPPALSGLEKAAWGNISPIGNNDPYILTRIRPVAPLLACPDSFCKFSPAVWFTTTGGGTSYSWTVNGGTIVSGQGTDSILVSWGGTGGTVSVIANGLGVCSSLPSNCTVNLAPSPLANFDTISLGPFNNTWNFVDSSNGTTIWTWYFGDGDSSHIQNPIHNYPASGTYTVTQVVMNQYGCLDTITKIIKVDEGILVPNVFSPDANGQNDVWYIPNSGVKEFHVTIFDRWGAKVFETTADEIRWDGRSLAGQLLTDGTYFYTLDFIYLRSSGEEMKNLTGTVTLLTSNRQK